MQKLFLYLFLLLPFLTSAQYIFNSIQTKDGLSAKEINCIYKDSEGFIWIGSVSGLNRYDGTKIKIFNTAHNNLNRLKDENITAVSEFEPGKIFIGTNLELAVYDKKSASLSAITFVNENKDTLKDISVSKLLKSPDHLWIATTKGLFVYDKNIAVPASFIFKEATALKDRWCIKNACLADSFRAGFWIGTTTGLFFLNYSNGSVSSSQNHADSLFNNIYFYSLTLDSKHNLWLSSKSHHLAYYDFGNDIQTDLSFFDADKKIPVKTSSPNLYVDTQDRLWISSTYYKILVREKDGSVITLPDQSPKLYKATYGNFSDAYTDDDGNLWLATLNGVSVFSASQPLQNLIVIPGNLPPPFLQEVAINEIRKAGDNLWWICTYDGLTLLNDKTGSKQPFTLSFPTINDNRFFDITLIENEWWCSTGNGIQIFNPVTKKFKPFTNYPPGHSISHRSVIWIYQDAKANIWFSAWGDAIYRYTPSTKTCIRFDGSEKKYGDITIGNHLSFLEDHNHKLWFGISNKGVRVFDYSTGTFSNPFPVNKNEILNSSIAYTIAEDSHHNIYAGTDNGIIQLTNNGVSKIAYTTKNGLPTNHNTNIFFDSYDNLWSAYDEDVYYKKPNASNFTSIRIQTGLPYGIDDWSHFEADKQNLYISLANQFAIVDLDKINHSLAEHAPLISSVSVFEKQIPFTIHHPKIDLKPDENFLTIDFSTQPGYNNAVAEYAYKLEDYDKDWVYCGKRQSAAYTNLPDGSYTFMVKCTRQKDDWDKAVTTISIYIAPPFYKSWWFILLIVLLTSLIAFWFYHLYKKRKQKKYVDRTIDYFANSVYGENSVNEICWDIARNCISQLALRRLCGLSF